MPRQAGSCLSCQTLGVAGKANTQAVEDFLPIRSPKTNITPHETMIRFNVFGTLVGVEWKNNEWKPYYLGNEGKRRDADFIIPTDITEDGIAHYLAVLFHEGATPERNEVKRIG